MKSIPWAIASGDDRVTGAVGFLGFGEKVDGVSAWSVNMRLVVVGDGRRK